MTSKPDASATFRPRRAKRRERWTLEGNIVSGEGKSIDLDRVTQAQFSDTRTPNRTYALRLRLVAPGSKLTIACDAKPGDSGRAGCGRLHAAILRRLHETNPDARVHIEGGPLRQLSSFGSFAALTVLAVLLSIATFTDGVVIAAVFFLVLAIGFGYFVYHFLPWPPGKFDRSPADAAEYVEESVARQI